MGAALVRAGVPGFETDPEVLRSYLALEFWQQAFRTDPLKLRQASIARQMGNSRRHEPATQQGSTHPLDAILKFVCRHDIKKYLGSGAGNGVRSKSQTQREVPHGFIVQKSFVLARLQDCEAARVHREALMSASTKKYAEKPWFQSMLGS